MSAEGAPMWVKHPHDIPTVGTLCARHVQGKPATKVLAVVADRDGRWHVVHEQTLGEVRVSVLSDFNWTYLYRRREVTE